MLVREIHQSTLRDEDFGPEWENVFFLSPSRSEVKLRCRRNSVQRKTYVSEADFLRLQMKDQLEFQENRANPRSFYCDASTAAHPAPRASRPKTRKRKTVADRAIGQSGRLWGRGFSIEKELGEWAYLELSDHPEFGIKEVPSGVIPYHRATGRRLDRDSLLALREKLESERSAVAIGGGCGE